MKFNFRVNDLELRSCDKRLTSFGAHDTAEIVQWSRGADGKAYCWAVAYWTPMEEGYDLKFVGDRPFRTNKDEFWRLAEQGQTILLERGVDES